MRTALDAGRLRLARQQLTETLLLALAGSILGATAAQWGVALLRTALGLRPEGLLTLRLQIPGTAYATEAEVAALTTALTGRFEALPGVAAVAATGMLPLGGGLQLDAVEVPGRPAPPPGGVQQAVYRVVSPGYFRIFGTPLVQGRELTTADRTGAPPVAVVNQTLARRLWPGGAAVGRTLRIGGGPERAVVGVVRDVFNATLDEPPHPEVYLPLRETPAWCLFFVLRTAGDPAALAGPAGPPPP